MLFAAVIHTVRRRKRRTNVRTIPVHTPPMWRLMAEEVVEAGRALRRRLTPAKRLLSPEEARNASTGHRAPMPVEGLAHPPVVGAGRMPGLITQQDDVGDRWLALLIGAPPASFLS